MSDPPDKGGGKLKLENEVRSIYPKCSDKTGREKFLQLLFTLSLYPHFKASAIRIGKELINIENSRHNKENPHSLGPNLEL